MLLAESTRLLSRKADTKHIHKDNARVTHFVNEQLSSNLRSFWRTIRDLFCTTFSFLPELISQTSPFSLQREVTVGGQ